MSNDQTFIDGLINFSEKDLKHLYKLYLGHGVHVKILNENAIQNHKKSVEELDTAFTYFKITAYALILRDLDDLMEAEKDLILDMEYGSGVFDDGIDDIKEINFKEKILGNRNKLKLETINYLCSSHFNIFKR